MPFVVDASIAVAWALKETHAKASVALTRVRTEGGVVPSLWWFEVRNGLLIGERRGRLTQHDTAFFLRRVSRLALTVDQAPDETGVLTLARRHRLTVYDAAYLDLALRESLPLATLDKELGTAARAEGVALIGADTDR
jgi:predicted nucleic acid-binding protein